MGIIHIFITARYVAHRQLNYMSIRHSTNVVFQHWKKIWQHTIVISLNIMLLHWLQNNLRLGHYSQHPQHALHKINSINNHCWKRLTLLKVSYFKWLIVLHSLRFLTHAICDVIMNNFKTSNNIKISADTNGFQVNCK